MSYSISVPVGPSEKFDEALDNAIDNYDFAGTNPDGQDVVTVARAHIKELASLVAKDGQYIGASISGHANPDRNNEGTNYGRDSMTINIYQSSPPTT